MRELAQGWVTANCDPHDNRVSSDSSLYHWAWSSQQTCIEHLLWARDPAVSKIVSEQDSFSGSVHCRKETVARKTCSLTQEDVR